MSVDQLLRQLFPGGHAVRREGDLLVGTGRWSAGELAVLGLCDGVEVGVELALRLATEVLRVVRDHPGRPILTLVDTRGQRMSKRDELLGLNGYLGHLAACVELARRAGHRILALVHGQAASGSFLALGLMADEIHAVDGANLSVMNLPAMSKVTKIPLERLERLSAASPVLAPGLANYVALGCVRSIWRAPLAAELEAALARPVEPDGRAQLGLERGGRVLAEPVAERVSGAAAPGQAAPRIPPGGAR
jgi:malonate decarboxylase gamma subunit